MKIKPYLLFVIFTLLFFNSGVHAQIIKPLVDVNEVKPINPDFCGSDYFHNQKMKNDPQYKARHLKTAASIQKITSQQGKLPNGILQVPVVVHIMHKGEAIGTGTNISNEDVKKGIAYLNNYWRKVAGSEGDGAGVDMKIEFSLAVQDENGDCTNGIERVDMSSVPAYVSNGVNNGGSGGIADYSSGGGVNSLKEYSIWNPTQYYNVWIVDEINNKNCNSNSTYIAGYAFYASSHGYLYDGSVVLICSYLDESSHIWAHEMGHAFNLRHTFEGDDPDKGQCGDDGIFDTPRHIRTSSISPSIYWDCNNSDVNTCDPTFNEVINPDNGFIRNTGTHQDHMHNYMDYTGCPSEFTGGQRSVVNAALTGIRGSFLSSAGLTPPSAATVYFSSSVPTVCLGDSVVFNDESSCTPNTYTNTGYDAVTFLWTINNGVDAPYTSTDQNPTIVFSNSGVYDVTLAVTNPYGTTSLTKAKSISVSAGVLAGCIVTSSVNDNNYGNGVTNMSFNTISNITSTYIPSSAMLDFTCSNNTTVHVGTPYNLDVTYKSRSTGSQYLEVWIDWDNSGTFQASNSHGVNERVLIDDIVSSATGTPSAIVTPPATAVLNTLLRMRVVSDYTRAPVLCGNGYILRADDYGVYVKAACTPPTAGITNNSGVTALTCAAPSIGLTATGGVSYLWDNNKGITPTIAVTEPGTYTVTVTSLDGCKDTAHIVITENKPLPTVVITSLSGATAITCNELSISLTATGGVSYSWDHGLGNSDTVSVTKAGTYTVTVTSANSCTDTESIIITNNITASACSITSNNDNNDFSNGVTRVSLNTLTKTTNTFIPTGAMQDFTCTDNTTLHVGTAYNLDVTYKSRVDGSQFLEVWIDWDSNGVFETTNSHGNNERGFNS